MFVEYGDGKFMNLSKVYKLYIEDYGIHYGFCGIHIGSQKASAGVLQELMTRLDEGRKVMFLKEFAHLCCDFCKLYPDDSEDSDA